MAFTNAFFQVADIKRIGLTCHTGLVLSMAKKNHSPSVLSTEKPGQDSGSTKHGKPRVGAHWREPLKV